MTDVIFKVSSAYAYRDPDWDTIFGPVYVRESENHYLTFSPDELEEAKFHFEYARHLVFNERRMLGLVHALSEKIIPNFSNRQKPNLITFVKVDRGSLKESPFDTAHTWIGPGGKDKKTGRVWTPTGGLENIVDNFSIYYDRRAFNSKQTPVLSPLKIQELVL